MLKHDCSGLVWSTGWQSPTHVRVSDSCTDGWAKPETWKPCYCGVMWCDGGDRCTATDEVSSQPDLCWQHQTGWNVSLNLQNPKWQKGWENWLCRVDMSLAWTVEGIYRCTVTSAVCTSLCFWQVHRIYRGSFLAFSRASLWMTGFSLSAAVFSALISSKPHYHNMALFRFIDFTHKRGLISGIAEDGWKFYSKLPGK